MKRKTDTPEILSAVFSGDLACLRERIVQGIDINARDRDGRTSLFQAIADGRDDIALLLIENGIDVEAKDNDGQTALHLAAAEHRRQIAERILSAGADVDALDVHGNTPLAKAVFASLGRGEIIALLIEHGASRENKNHSGMSPWDLAKSIANYNVLQFLK